MAQHQRLGLRAVQQAGGNARKGRMEQRSLPFDHIPAAILARWCQMLDRARNEIRNYGIHRDAVTGDQYACLPGGAKIGEFTACAQPFGECEGGIHFDDRAIGANRQQSATGAPAAVADFQAGGRVAHIDQLAPQLFCKRDQTSIVAQPPMQPRL